MCVRQHGQLNATRACQRRGQQGRENGGEEGCEKKGARGGVR